VLQVLLTVLLMVLLMALLTVPPPAAPRLELLALASPAPMLLRSALRQKGIVGPDGLIPKGAGWLQGDAVPGAIGETAAIAASLGAGDAASLGVFVAE
jgi:hypothetical protein